MVPRKWMNIYGAKTETKMNNPPKIIVDADAIIAQASPYDKHHQTAATISESLAKVNAQVIYPATAIAESNAYMQRVLNSTASAYGTAVVFADLNVQVAEINQNTLRNALKYFSPETSKKNTLFDCIIAAVAEEYKADAIFSFDKFYERKGFKLVTELELPK
ncbi:MAG: hypothetical protein UV17_C0060G0020 [Candidatus Gottesmanbacteria bacterium GW2011_GWA1_42_26]|nr:MAG: hypothetical protein UV17_C0060G0020 [Candidatus Gottesmanbacteria bacterium GW2011_GWA1_42_26]